MLEFSRAGAAVGATPATLEKTRILGAYFRTLNDDDLRRAAVFMSGRAFPPSQRRTLGLGWSTVSKVVSSLSERGENELGEIFRKHSDLGDWAGEALDGSTEPEPVTLADVEASLNAIRTARGNAKAKPLESLLKRMDAAGARFFIKIVSGEMRIGLSEGLVEAAIAEAFGVPITQVKRVHLVTGDIGETAVRCRRGDFEATAITPFQPVRFMLASPVETPGEVF
jgi:DNA ligase 1